MNPHLAPGLCVVYPSETPPVESSYFHTKLHELCSPRLQLQEHTAPVRMDGCLVGLKGIPRIPTYLKDLLKRCESSQFEIQLIEYFNSKTVLLHFGRIPLLNFIAGSTNRLCLVIGNLLFSQHGHLKAAINHRQNPKPFCPMPNGLPVTEAATGPAMEALGDGGVGLSELEIERLYVIPQTPIGFPNQENDYNMALQKMIVSYMFILYCFPLG